MRTNDTTVKTKNNRLGRGLDALLGPSKSEAQVLLLDIEKIYPKQRTASESF